jgi:toxin-antitoxin system PIN domain toxin
VIAVDTNVLVHAHRRDSPWHAAARDQVRALAEGRTPWAIPWQCLVELVGVVTHPRIYLPPSTANEAIAQVDTWLGSPSLSLLTETPTTWGKLRPLLVTARIAGPRVHDARIAALCLDHGVTELWSADRDFSRFPSLRVTNPLVVLRP